MALLWHSADPTAQVAATCGCWSVAIFERINQDWSALDEEYWLNHLQSPDLEKRLLLRYPIFQCCTSRAREFPRSITWLIQSVVMSDRQQVQRSSCLFKLETWSDPEPFSTWKRPSPATKPAWALASGMFGFFPIPWIHWIPLGGYANMENESWPSLAIISWNVLPCDANV